MAPRRTQKRAQRDEDEEEETDYSDSPGPSRGAGSKGGKKSASQKKKGGKGKKNTRNDDDEDEEMSEEEEDDETSTTKKGKDLSEDEKKELIQGIVRYVLFNEGHRRVLKREDIVKNVLTDGRGRHFNHLMPKVQKVLKDFVGMELVLLRPKETGGGKNPPKAWLLRSTIPQPLLRHAATSTSSHYLTTSPFSNELQESGGGGGGGSRTSLKEELSEWYRDEVPLEQKKDDQSDEEDEDDEEEVVGGVMRDVKREEGPAYGILGVILALILVNGKVLGDDQLISYLRRLQLYPSSPIPLSLSSPHPSHLTLSTYLTNLTKQQYLERAKTGQAIGGGGSTQATQSGRGRPSNATQSGPTRTQRTTTGDGGGIVQESGDPSIEWRWGARAEAELGEEGIAKFVQFIFQAQSNLVGGGGAGGKGKGKKRGKTGEKFLTEVARAAGVKELQRAEKVEGGGFN